jgi:hypothetical protein
MGLGYELFAASTIQPMSTKPSPASSNQQTYDGWLRTIPIEQRPNIALLLAGYRHQNQVAVPMVYLLISNIRFAPQLAAAYPMMVGVPQYAVYLSHR